jgi:hypothetical protein
MWRERMYLGAKRVCQPIITKASRGVKLTGAGGVGMMTSVFEPLALMVATRHIVRWRDGSIPLYGVGAFWDKVFR